MRLQVGCEFVYVAQAPTHAIVQVEPRPDGDFQIIEDTLELQPEAAFSRYIDGFGNLCRRTMIPVGESVLRYNAIVDVSPDPDPVEPSARELAPEELPAETLTFTMPSRFCPSDELGDMAWELFGSVAPGWGRVQAVCDWVHKEVVFGYGASNSMTNAVQVYESRTGVCRDFAHLAVTFCRALNIPARYAFGYLPDIGVPEPHTTMDFCAWTEVYLEDRWWTFDPRNNTPRVGRVLIGRGRDALDVAMVTTYGGPTLRSMTVIADRAA